MPLALFVTQNGQLFHVSKELSILPTDCAKKISKEAEAFTITSLFPKVTKMVSFSLPNIYIGPGIRFDIPTLKPILSIRQVYREAEVEAYYKSVPMLPPLLGIFPPIHPPIEACPRLARPSLSCRHHHRYLLHRRITNFKGGHWSRKKYPKSCYC